MKKSMIAFISAFAIPYIVLSILIFLVDPYYVFHAPWFQMEPIQTHAAHYVARGLIRNMDYDILVCGSSMCENMHTDYVDEVFDGKSIKVIQHGSYSNDFAASLKQAAESGKAQTVIMGLDTGIWQKPSDGYRIENIPQYAVTAPTAINAASYLYNIDNLEPCLELVNANRNRKPAPMNSWWGYTEDSYSQENVAAAWRELMAEGSDSDEMDETLAWENYSNLMEGLEECAAREVRIKFFIPPYSIAYLSLHDYVHDLDVYKEIWREILQYDNVELYAIQFDTDLIQHLEWYRNTNHYNGLVSDRIIKNIADKRFLLTPDNIDEQVDIFKQFLDSYDWEELEASLAQ